VDDDMHVHLEVALEVGGSDTIRGTVADRDGRRTAFTGWLELMSAFDTARAGPVAGGEPPAGSA
jgi:hypothetical protein